MAHERRTAGAGFHQESERDESGKINTGQIVAATSAATTGALVANLLGIYGTVAGVAVLSVISSVGTVLYLKSMRHTRDMLRALARAMSHAQQVRRPVPARFGTPPATSYPTRAILESGDGAAPSASRPWWVGQARSLALTAVTVFILSLGMLSGIAAMSGQSGTPGDDVAVTQPAGVVALDGQTGTAPADPVTVTVTAGAETVHGDSSVAEPAGPAFDTARPVAAPASGAAESRDPPSPGVTSGGG